MIDWRKYLYVLVITSLIFGTAVFLANYFNGKKLAEVKRIADQLSVDILSSETQFALLQESSCENLTAPVLSEELGSLGERLAYAEEQFGAKNGDVESLRRYYSLLELKDYLLSKRIADKCGGRPAFVIYLYSNEGDCPDCEKEGFVLTYLREKYPALRVYSFDYHLDLSAVKTLLSIFKIKDELPAIVVNDRVYYGFKTKEELESLLPAKLRATAQKAATSTAQ
ncbi:hypothetical protein KW797_02365 [Candidatus Parcubacteria bacterium]|nr:hypothetical protein [Candidatus Parcubacteria bacterium]